MGYQQVITRARFLTRSPLAGCGGGNKSLREPSTDVGTIGIGPHASLRCPYRKLREGGTLAIRPTFPWLPARTEVDLARLIHKQTEGLANHEILVGWAPIKAPDLRRRFNFWGNGEPTENRKTYGNCKTNPIFLGKKNNLSHEIPMSYNIEIGQDAIPDLVKRTQFKAGLRP